VITLIRLQLNEGMWYLRDALEASSSQPKEDL